MEHLFATYRDNVVGRQQRFVSPYGEKRILYADWTASGRAYRPIEDCIQREMLPFVGNTHTGTTITGTYMSRAYEEAKAIIKRHVGATDEDALIFCGSGMTAAVNKLQRLLGLRAPAGMMAPFTPVAEVQRPVVFVTHMEHHSNHTSWLETIALVEVIGCDADGRIDLDCFREQLKRHRHRPYKIAAVTACSNVTGIQTPYKDIARLIHEQGGFCFVDFACSAPYIAIDMAAADLDAIYFSAHKFLGGPGTPGVLVFHKRIYHNPVPDHPGGGTVAYTNPWGERMYVDPIEQREDGGTPPFLQGIKAAMCIRLKEDMGVDNMLLREQEMCRLIFTRFARIRNVTVLEGAIRDRLGVFSFIVEGAHYSLIVQLLNDRFGIQTRGGCSCAGTYGHKLLHVDKTRSRDIWSAIRSGNLLAKPGWIRLSIHPVMTDAEVMFIMDAIEQTAANFRKWQSDYSYDPAHNEFVFNGVSPNGPDRVAGWFTASRWS
jgi:selenocysteine lyase/cysteine desulfurase